MTTHDLGVFHFRSGGKICLFILLLAQLALIMDMYLWATSTTTPSSPEQQMMEPLTTNHVQDSPGPAKGERAEITPQNDREVQEDTERYDPLDSELALEWAKSSDQIGNTYRAGHTAPNPHNSVSNTEKLVWVQSHREDGTLYPPRGEDARNYPIIQPPKFCEHTASVISTYLGGAYEVTARGWTQICARQLPPTYREYPWWVRPSDGPSDIPNQVCNVSAHLYIWMMSARYVDPVLPDYEIMWDPLRKLANPTVVYEPSDALVPPFELLEGKADRIRDRDNFHGKRNWREDLCRTTQGFPMPSLAELVRTDIGALDKAHAPFPVFWILRYLEDTRRAPGYYGNTRLREFTKHGRWQGGDVPFDQMNNSFQDLDQEFDLPGSSAKECRQTGHLYSAAELYWMMVNIFSLEANHVWDFIAYAIHLPCSSPAGVHLGMCLNLFEYVNGERESLPQSLLQHVETHPLPQLSVDSVSNEPDCMYPGMIRELPKIAEWATYEELETWKEHCNLEYATSQLRPAFPAHGIRAKVATGINPAKGARLGPVVKLQNVKVARNMFLKGYSRTRKSGIPIPIDNFIERPSRLYGDSWVKPVHRDPLVYVEPSIQGRPEQAEKVVAEEKPRVEAIPGSILPDKLSEENQSETPLGGGPGTPKGPHNEAVPVPQANASPPSETPEGQLVPFVREGETENTHRVLPTPHDGGPTLATDSSREIDDKIVDPEVTQDRERQNSDNATPTTAQGVEQSQLPRGTSSRSLEGQTLHVDQLDAEFDAHEDAMKASGIPAFGASTTASTIKSKSPLGERKTPTLPQRDSSGTAAPMSSLPHSHVIEQPDAKQLEGVESPKSVEPSNAAMAENNDNKSTPSSPHSHLGTGESMARSPSASQKIPPDSLFTVEGPGNPRSRPMPLDKQKANKKISALHRQAVGAKLGGSLPLTSADHPQNAMESLKSTETPKGPVGEKVDNDPLPTSARSRMPTEESSPRSPLLSQETPPDPHAVVQQSEKASTADNVRTDLADPNNLGSLEETNNFDTNHSEKDPGARSNKRSWEPCGEQEIPRKRPRCSSDPSGLSRQDASSVALPIVTFDTSRRSKQAASKMPAKGTPPGPQPYRCWTPSEVVSLQISYDQDDEPHLDGEEIPLYDCICELDLGADMTMDPPRYVHLSDKQIGRLYLLVWTGYRTLAYLSATWPHVFDSNGAVWRHREPQGEPFLLWRTYDYPNMNGRTEYAVACGSYILMGGAAWNKMRMDGTRPYLLQNPQVTVASETGALEKVPWSEAGHIATVKAQAVHPDELQLLCWLPSPDEYLYNTENHRFATVVDPFRIKHPTVNVINDESRQSLPMLDFACKLDKLREEHTGKIPISNVMETATLDHKECTQGYWWLSYHTIKRRHIEMVLQDMPVLETVVFGPTDGADSSRETMIDLAHIHMATASSSVARGIATSQENWNRADHHNDQMTHHSDQMSYHSDQMNDHRDRMNDHRDRMNDHRDRRNDCYEASAEDLTRAAWRYSPNDPALPVIQDDIDNGATPTDARVYEYAEGVFDGKPEARARWHEANKDKIDAIDASFKGFMPDYCDKNIGEPSLRNAGLTRTMESGSKSRSESSPRLNPEPRSENDDQRKVKNTRPFTSGIMSLPVSGAGGHPVRGTTEQ
jgi:hypothetical protein